MGVPAESVVHKLTVEGIDAKKVKMFSAAHGVATRITSKRRAPPGTAPPKDRRASNMITVHWDALPQERLENTVWATGSSCELQSEELQQLESLFTAKPTKQVVKAVGASTAGKKKAVALLDGKRANNIAIALAQFKNFERDGDWGSLCEAVMRQDESDLNVDKLDALTDNLPTDAEARKVGGFRGNLKELGKAERFVFSIQEYPRFQARLDAFSFKLHFQARAKSLLERAGIVESAAMEIKQSEGLAFILKQMLVIGNIMNQGTRQGQASGITLESLLKLIHTRGADKKTTVLDYVITLCMDKGQEGLLEFPADFKSLTKATRISAREVTRELRELHKKIATLDKEARTSQDEAAKAKATPDSVSNDAEEAPASPESGGGGGNAALFAAIKSRKGKKPGAGRAQSKMGKISPELLEAYAEQLQSFAERAMPKYQDVSLKVQGMDEAIQSLAQYFGEDPNRCQAENVFTALQQFMQAFRVSKDKVARLRKSQEKQRAQQQESKKKAEEKDVSELLRSSTSRLRAAVAGESSSEEEDDESD